LVNTSLLDERKDSCYKCEDLEAELKKVRSDIAMSVATLEAKVKFAKIHTAEVAAASDKRLSNFEFELIRDLAGLRKLYVCNVQSIGGLSLPMPGGDPSVVDYICWLSMDVAGLPEIFARINENFISATIEGALVMAGQSIDLSALQDTAAVSGANILPVELGVRRAAHAVVKKWWRSFGYDYVLAAIHTKLHEVTTALLFQVLKEKEEETVENAPFETPSKGCPEATVDVEIAKITSQILTPSNGQDAAKTVTGATPTDANREERAEV
jgi:hypothetical protein